MKLTPWQKGVIVYAVFALMLVGVLVMIARRAAAEIVVNSPPGVERLFTVAEVNAALAAQAQLSKELHDRQINEIVIAARLYIKRELATGCQGQI